MRTRTCPANGRECVRQICLRDHICDKRDNDNDNNDGRPWRKPGPPPLRPHLEDA